MITMKMVQVVVIVVRIRKIYLSMFLGISSVCPFPEMKVVLLRRAVMMMVKNLVIIVPFVVRRDMMMMKVIPVVLVEKLAGSRLYNKSNHCQHHFDNL